MYVILRLVEPADARALIPFKVPRAHEAFLF
jgi:hypothetical protein